LNGIGEVLELFDVTISGFNNPSNFTLKKKGFLRNLEWFFTSIHSRNLFWFRGNCGLLRNHLWKIVKKILQRWFRKKPISWISKKSSVPKVSQQTFFTTLAKGSVPTVSSQRFRRKSLFTHFEEGSVENLSSHTSAKRFRRKSFFKQFRKKVSG
jgi:hypothetical protein